MSTRTSIARPDWLSERAWPWPVHALPTPGGPLAVTDVGEGPTLLMVHVGLWSFIWRDLIARLSAQYRCVTLDAPGNGLSRRPAGHGCTLQDAAEAVGEVIDALDLTDVTLVLHDLGGPAGLAAGARRPDRIAAVAAVNTFGWRPRGLAFRGMLALMGSGAVRELDALTGWLPAATSTRAGAGRHWASSERAAFRHGVDRAGRRAIHRYFADARAAEGLYADVDAALRGALADRPLLTVFGQRNDPLRFQPEWKRRFPHARQEVVPAGYHFPMCDDPTAVAGWIHAWHVEQVRRPA